MGTVLVGGVAVALWRSEHPPIQAVRIYPTTDACRQDHLALDCDLALAGAQARHEATAPHYALQNDCENVYGAGQCAPCQGSAGGFFIPLMAGFMIGRAVASPLVAYQPVYVDRQGFAYSAGAPVGPYRRNCEDTNSCTSGGGMAGVHGGGYVWRQGSANSEVWGGGEYQTRHVALPRSVSGGTGVTRGGFGSIGRAFAHLGG